MGVFLAKKKLGIMERLGANVGSRSFFPRGGRAVQGTIYGFFAAEVESTIDANEPGNEMLGGLGYYYF